MMDHVLFEAWKLRITVGDALLLVIVLLATPVLLRLVRRAFARHEARRPEHASRLHSMYLLLKYLLWVVTAVATLRIIGLDLTLMLAGSAALLVGLGIGIQSTFNDIVSGIIILAEGTIRVGDVLEIEGLVGRVTRIDLRTSTVYTRDGMNVIVPNNRFINENVVNWSHQALETRFRIQVGVAYGSDERQVLTLLRTCAGDHPMVIADDAKHPILVRLIEFGDSALLFELLFWSRNTFPIEQTKSEIRLSILERFREAGVSIPFPQRDVHVYPSGG
jgi:small-conductance mechanosensitive channel